MQAFDIPWKRFNVFFHSIQHWDLPKVLFEKLCVSSTTSHDFQHSISLSVFFDFEFVKNISQPVLHYSIEFWIVNWSSVWCLSSNANDLAVMLAALFIVWLDAIRSLLLELYHCIFWFFFFFINSWKESEFISLNNFVKSLCSLHGE